MSEGRKSIRLGIERKAFVAFGAVVHWCCLRGVKVGFRGEEGRTTEEGDEVIMRMRMRIQEVIEISTVNTS